MRPRVDVYDLAARLGARTIESDRLEVDGLMDDPPQGATIVLKRLSPLERKRFTLAHELGHLVLSEPEVLHLAHHAAGSERLDVEQLCNAFAAELLMPRHWLVRAYRDRSERLDVLDDLTEAAGVSISAALTRFATVLRWRSSLVYFHRRNGWTPVVIAGARRRLSRVEVPSSSAKKIAALAHAEESHETSIEIWAKGQRVVLHGEARRSAAGVLFLAALPPRARGR